MADGDTVPETGIPALDPDVEELWSSRALLLVLILLIGSFWVSYYLKVRRIKSIHETIVALVAGMFVGFILRVSPGVVVQSMVSFKNTILLNVLLPPIILNSGFELRQENFFRNFGVILAFAFAGTFISAIVLGVTVYIWALLGLEGLSLTIIECLIFGSTLSATDPVTILAIFNTLKVDPKLYSIIFGESILNDAVAIVMFETLSQFHGEKIHVLSFFHGVGIFLLTFLTSMALGVIFGLGCSLMLKHSSLAHFHAIETCLVTLIAYTSYFFSNGLTMSGEWLFELASKAVLNKVGLTGIVSLLFCGITLKHYAYHNMSRRTQRTTKYMFATLAQLSENFIFIYLGLSLFTQENLVYKPLFILVTALGVCVARYSAVFPISKVINVVFRARGTRTDELPHSYQMMLFWAGLRGSVGVALAAGIKGESGPALRTTVLVTVVLTMIIFGGTTSRMIEIVGIRTGCAEEEDSSEDDDPLLGRGGGYHDLTAARSVDSKYPARNEDASETPYRDHGAPADGMRLHPFGNGPSHSRQGSQRSPPISARSSGFGRNLSQASFDSDESDQEVLPMANEGDLPPEDPTGGPRDGAVWRDGQWFNVLDERYLLPVFSNATASRRQATRKALRSKSRSQLHLDQLPDSETDITTGGESPSIPDSPWLARAPQRSSWGGPEPTTPTPRTRGSKGQGEFSGSFGTVLSSLIGTTDPSNLVSPSAIGKRRESDEEGATLDLTTRSQKERSNSRTALGRSTGSLGGSSSTNRSNSVLVDVEGRGG